MEKINLSVKWNWKIANLELEYFTGGNPMKGMLFNILNQDIDYIDMYEWTCKGEGLCKMLSKRQNHYLLGPGKILLHGHPKNWCLFGKHLAMSHLMIYE